jgi:hypothetical protein
MRATFPTILTHRYFINIIIFCEAYTLWGSLCYFFNPPVTSSLPTSKYSKNPLLTRPSANGYDRICLTCKGSGPQQLPKSSEFADVCVMSCKALLTCKVDIKRFAMTGCLHVQPYRWKQYVPPKCLHLSARPHGVTTHKKTIDMKETCEARHECPDPRCYTCINLPQASRIVHRPSTYSTKSVQVQIRLSA